MAVDNPNNGLICSPCLDAFDRFRAYTGGKVGWSLPPIETSGGTASEKRVTGCSPPPACIASLAASLTADDVCSTRHHVVRSITTDTVVTVCHRDVLVRWRRVSGRWEPERWVDSGEDEITWLERIPDDASRVLMGSIRTGFVELYVEDMSTRRVARIVGAPDDELNILVGDARGTRIETVKRPAPPGCQELRLGPNGTIVAVGRYSSGLVASSDYVHFEPVSLPPFDRIDLPGSGSVGSIAWVGDDLVVMAMADNGEVFDVALTRFAGADPSRPVWVQQDLHGIGRASALAVSATGARLAVFNSDRLNETHETGVVRGDVIVLDATTGDFRRREPVEFLTEETPAPSYRFGGHRQVVSFVGETVAVWARQGLHLVTESTLTYVPIGHQPCALDGTPSGLIIGTDRGVMGLDTDDLRAGWA